MLMRRLHMMKQLLMRRLNLAMKSSKEAEIVRANAMKDDAQLAEYESIALETVKRVSAAKSALSDRLLVKGIFENAAIPGNSPVASIVLKLVERIQSKYSDDVNLSPEAFVEGLLTEGSSMTAVSCLGDGGGFTLDHFRQVASLVHRACKTLADMYSHVHVGKCARRLAKRWLVHGDDVSGRQDPSDVKKMTHHSREANPNCTFAANKSSEQAVVMLESFSLEEEDDTANFVMDLNAIATNQDVWSDDIVSSENIPGRVENITADEEPSAIKYPGSARETSEYNNARVAIRIAFVISFADGYHQHKMKSGSGDKENNSHLNENDNSQSKSRFKKLRLSNSEGSQQGDSATEHARELLEIVFAKSGGSNWVNSRSTFAGAAESTAISTKSPLGRSFSANVSTLKKVSKNGSSSDRKTITFAMRHRALRTASILCPQEVLDMIIKEEGYFNVTEDAASRCTLSLCAFGSFLAMEIEAMGLSLPHSDLVRLSTMHFPSYARALWRHHGRSDCRGFKGRLLLLLLDLCIKDGKVADKSLMNSIITEMANYELPRTLLSACERIAAVDRLESLMSNDEDIEAIMVIMKKAAHSIFSETRRHISTDSNPIHFMIVLRRFGKVVEKLGSCDYAQDQLSNFVDLLCILAHDSASIQKEWIHGMLDIATGVANCIRCRESRLQIFKKITKIDGGRDLLETKFAISNTLDYHVEITGRDGGKSSNDMVKRVEDSFALDMLSLITELKTSSTC
uniref:Uncharacterized protein n=1 Tax=Ditylum brightwellii TaxID=49249 RepID=A0A6V2FME6_9STRA